MAWAGHLRPSLLVSVLGIDLRVIGHLKPRGRDDFKSQSRGDSIVVSILWCPAPEIVAIMIYYMPKHHIFNAVAPENVMGLIFHEMQRIMCKCKSMTFSGATPLKI